MRRLPMQLLKFLLDWPNIHKPPSRVAALKLLGFTSSTMHGSPDDATQVLPPITDAMQSEKVLLENAYRRHLDGDDQEAKQDVSARIKCARDGIQVRVRARGASLTATLVFIGFLVAAQVAIIIAHISGYEKLATKPTILGLLVILWGMLPTFDNLVPRFRGDEGEEAIAKTEFDWLCEDVNRSSSQRQQLWRLRVALALSLGWTSLTLLLLFFA